MLGSKDSKAVIKKNIMSMRHEHEHRLCGFGLATRYIVAKSRITIGYLLTDLAKEYGYLLIWDSRKEKYRAARKRNVGAIESSNGSH